MKNVWFIIFVEAILVPTVCPGMSAVISFMFQPCGETFCPFGTICHNICKVSASHPVPVNAKLSLK